VGWKYLEEKLTACMQNLKKWKEQSNQPHAGHISQLRESLAELQGKEGMVNTEAINGLKKEIKLQLDRDDLWWHQRAKVNWLKHGDRNTKYFHACVNSRRKKKQN
jgi:tryptophan synthase beta subunit